MTHRIDFSQSVTVRIPAIGKEVDDEITIYSSDTESIYNGNPGRTFEQTGVVENIYMDAKCSSPDYTDEESCLGD